MKGSVNRIKYLERVMELGLVLFVVGMALISFKVNTSQARSNENLALNETNVEARSAALLPIQGTVCIVDDSNGNQLTFDTTTGAYSFTDCKGFMIAGTGSVTVRGCYVTLVDIRSDRRVQAQVDDCLKRANAAVQTLSPTAPTRTIIDRNTANDICGCASQGAIRREVLKGTFVSRKVTDSLSDRPRD